MSLFPSTFNLASLDGRNGFCLDGVASSDKSGYAVSAAGDVNGDGVADLLVGASDAGPGGEPSAGSTYVVFGQNTAVSGLFSATFPLANLDGHNGFQLNGVAVSDQLQP